MWIVKPKPNPGAQLKLFCLPFAGGGSASFRNWAGLLPPQIELCAVEIPGRGARLSERFFRRLDDLLPELGEAIIAELNKPFAIFGHSMGALTGFELTHFIKDKYGRQPVHLFLSGRGAPHLPDRTAPIHQLPEADFIREIKRYNGTPKEVLEHQELMEIITPILRADFEVCETYQFRQKAKLECPLTVVCGLQDEGATRAELEAWREQCAGPFNLRMFPGDHFYLLEHKHKLVETIVRDISNHYTFSSY